MPNSIAFFPWVYLSETLTVGSIRLRPFERRRRPRGKAGELHRDIKGVLRAYAARKNQLVKEATLLEIGDWHLGQDAADHVQQLFRARELIVFSALSARRLFHGSSDYCNFDTYAFVVQNYQAGSVGAFSFFTRRRDGGTNQLWDTKEFTFLKPLHVDFNARAKLDSDLLQALLNADSANALPYEAIVEFNRANTDSIDVPIHIELVMMKSAFEFLLSISEKNTEFARALSALVPNRPAKNAPLGPLISRWKNARARAKRPLEAWALEFCDLRGGAAHGKNRGGTRFVWSEQAHLAFGSMLFPLLARRLLSRAGFLKLREHDEIELDQIEDYLGHDPFSRTSTTRERQHPWSRIYGDRVLREVLRRRLADKLTMI